jgi:hypothetical protein
MAGIYLSTRSGNTQRRHFRLGEKPLSEIVEPFGVRPENRVPTMPVEPGDDSDLSLIVIVSIEEAEAQGTEFERGDYRARIAPHLAMRHCGGSLSAILGSAAG